MPKQGIQAIKSSLATICQGLLGPSARVSVTGGEFILGRWPEQSPHSDYMMGHTTNESLNVRFQWNARMVRSHSELSRPAAHTLVPG